MDFIFFAVSLSLKLLSFPKVRRERWSKMSGADLHEGKGKDVVNFIVERASPPASDHT